MKQIFLRKDNNPCLLLIFGGWGSWPGLFSEYSFPDGYDVMLCYDYRSSGFNKDLLAGYGHVRIVAWSMGVKVASIIMSGTVLAPSVSCADSIAVNGTMFPVDDSRGIPENVFAGTLERMGAPVLEKFLRRMCGKDLGYYKERMHDGRYPLDRSVENLKEELASLRTFVQENASCGTGFRWTAAVVGRGDLVFPAANQFRAWEGTGVRVVGTDCAHYDRDLFGSLLCCPEHFPVIPDSNSDVFQDSLSEVIPESTSEVVPSSLFDVIPSVAEGSESPRP